MDEEWPSNVIHFPWSHGAEAVEALEKLLAEFDNAERILTNFKINKSGWLLTITSEYILLPKPDDEGGEDEAR